MSLRAFVALEVPAHALDLLTSFQRELSASGADIKLVERGNLHFTVKFLGEISDSEAHEVDTRLRGLSLKSAVVGLRGVGAFPTPSRPRVVWVGVSKEQEELVVPMAQRVIDSLEGIGEREGRPFQLHLTLARVRSGRNARELQEVILQNAGRSFGTAELNSLKLKSSTLTPDGPVYRDVGEYPLA